VNKVGLALVATSAGLGVLSVHLIQQMRDGQATIADLQAQVAMLEKQQQEPPRISFGSAIPAGDPARFVVLPAEPDTSSRSAASSAAPQAVQAAADVAPPPRRSSEDRMRMMREHRERQRQLMQDPEYREAMRVQARSNFSRSYPGMVEELGLDSTQAEEFFDLLADQQMRSSEQLESLWDMDGKDSAAVREQQRKIQQQAAQLQRTGEAEMAARFGQDKLQAWKDYQSTLGVRHQLESMRSMLAGQGLPLSDDPNKAMLKALAAAQKPETDAYSAAVNRGAAPAMLPSSIYHAPEKVETLIEATRKRNQRTLDAISPYLTYEQREVIEKQQQAQLKVQEAQMRIMRTQGSMNALRPYAADPSVQSTIMLSR
jgi:uncharacterized beta-barrel protein YwiB (DUF1934 family)